ncbi:MAG: serine/threonine protein kinase [Actinobacteria bacterium]|nr:MAG: serine/threonine protein kinase [Actinomycetota bacterium]
MTPHQEAPRDVSPPSEGEYSADAGAPAELRDSLIGTVLDDRYRIIRRLARGGMATVYVAHDDRLDRPIAIKVMHPHLADSPDFLVRFEREARSAARIVHHSVVSVFDQGVVDGRGFIVMELIKGPSLRSLLRAQGSFTLSQALRYTREILDALRAAGRVGVIHRDIKPENVLVPTDGPVTVTDFGLARAASHTSTASTTTLGTVSYMAPEVATSGSSDVRTDLYSVGIMLYEMIVGTPPWQGENALHVAYAHVHSDIPPPSDAHSWIPREVDDLVATLAARDPLERPTSAQEALDLLDKVSASLPQDLASRRADVTPTSPLDDEHTVTIVPDQQTSVLPKELLPPPQKAPSLAVTPAAAAEESQLIRRGADPSPTSSPTPPAKHRRAVRLIALLLTLVIAGTAAGWWWWVEYGPGAYVMLPTTDGRAVSDVQRDIETLGLRISIEEAFSDTVEKGVVISSQPESQTSVHKDTRVTLVVSKGVDMRTVPDVSAKPYGEAQAILQEAGFTLGETTEDWSEEIPLGAVISQSVEAGTQLRVDSSVDLVVSKGRQPIDVENYVDTQASETKTRLEEQGLTVTVTEEYSDTVAEGVIIRQAPAAGTQVYRGDTIELVVSRGPEMIEVPDVYGKSATEAKQLLEEAGFTVSVEDLFGGLFGTAHSTDPPAGTVVRKGSSITLRVV